VPIHAVILKPQHDAAVRESGSKRKREKEKLVWEANQFHLCTSAWCCH